MSTFVIIVIILIAFVVLYTNSCEKFYIEPNTIMGGASPESGMVMEPNGQYVEYSTPLELEGPGDAAWSGY